MGKNKSQRGITVPPLVEVLIAAVFKDNPKRTAREIRNLVISEICRNPKLFFPNGIPPKYSHAIEKRELEWPSLSKVNKVLTPLKKKLNESSKEDNPWCMGTLSEFPIPLEAVPDVLKVWKLRVAREERFTVREAKWAAMVSRLAKDIEQLSWQANNYAYLEYLYESVGQPFDSTILDMFYMQIPLSLMWGIEDDEEKQEFMFVPEIVSEGLKDEFFEPVRGQRFLYISASKEDVERYQAEAEKRDKEWEAYKKEAQNEGEHKKKRQA